MPGPIDVHTHWCLFGRSQDAVLAELKFLETSGYDAVVVFPLPSMGASPEAVVEMIPGAYRRLISMTVARASHDDLEAWWSFLPLWRNEPHRMNLLSFLDVRAWDGVTDLAAWWGEGHAGLKGILVAEEDAEKMSMRPLRGIPGLSREGYFEAQRALFRAADQYKVPLLFHVDLTQHDAFVRECLQQYPELRVDIPHFGFSRRAMAALLDRFPGVMTDTSSLAPQLAAAPDSYRGFIEDYPDRVMLGSDVIASFDLGKALDYEAAVRALGLSPQAEAGVLSGNARRFLFG